MSDRKCFKQPEFHSSDFPDSLSSDATAATTGKRKKSKLKRKKANKKIMEQRFKKPESTETPMHFN